MLKNKGSGGFKLEPVQFNFCLLMEVHFALTNTDTEDSMHINKEESEREELDS